MDSGAAESMETASDNRERVICPVCGYKMPIFYDHDAKCSGVYVKCKGRDCGKIIEIIIRDK